VDQQLLIYLFANIHPQNKFQGRGRGQEGMVRASLTL
jgi:hypothetical protein